MRNISNKTVVILVCVCIVALCGMLIALVCTGKSSVSLFTPPPFEENAQSGIPHVQESTGWDMLDTDAFRVGICGTVGISDHKANVWLTNPNDNTVWMKLRVLDADGNILGETGLITPGQYVESVVLADIPPEGAPVVLKIMTYEPETYHSAGSISVNTAIYESPVR